MLSKLRVRWGCKVPNPITWLSTKKPDGTEKFTMTGSVDGCSVLPEAHFVGTRLCVDITQVLFVGGFLPPMVTARERPEFDI